MATKRNNTTNLSNNSSILFTPSITRDVLEGSNGIATYETQDGNLTENTSLGLSGSFKYDPEGHGLKSTQQLKVDWDTFSAHTFFNSAQVKTNVAFQKILNEYPFDGNKQRVELFLDSLTGFEKYVYETFPKNKDYLYFSGTNVGETYGGSHIITKDAAGAAFPNASINTTGETILDPGSKSMTLEFHMFLPEQANSNQTVVDKHYETGANDCHGFYVGLNSTGSLFTGSLSFFAMSGSTSDSLTVELIKGQWNHVAWVWDRNLSQNTISCYVNQDLVSSSSNFIEFDSINTFGSDLLIGSGSNLADGTLFSPVTTFSGALDEMRLWHCVRTNQELLNYEKKAIFADDTNLKLYYRFDEPSDTTSNIVIDYSNNSLHGRISAGAVSLGVRSIDKDLIAPNPMTYQKLEYSPVLFPDSTEIIALQNSFLTDAIAYDKINPNLITRLIPPHFLEEGQAEEGLSTTEGGIVQLTTGGEEPRSARLGGTQTFLLLLYTWAKFLDEIKLYTQAFSNLDFVDYDDTDTVPDIFLQEMASRYGLTLPPLFQGSSIEQFIEGENVDNVISTNSLSLQNVQNQIWRRILINMQDFMKSKGTLHSVKSFIRTIGIDPDSTLRIREYGGPTKQALNFSRDKKTEVSTMINFVSGGILKSAGLVSPTTKTEPGWPYNGSTSIFDRTLTSGSFTLEGTYKFPVTLDTGASQSLMRMHVSTSLPNDFDTGDILLMNVVATKGGNVDLYARNLFFTFSGPLADTLVCSITGADVFDGSPWYVSCGRQRTDDPSFELTNGFSEAQISTNVSSSYFLRLSKAENGEIVETYTTSSFYMEAFPNVDSNLFEFGAANYSPYMAIGSGSIQMSTGSIADMIALSNTSSYVPVDSQYTNFTGKVSQIRFWSKYLIEQEWKEHVRNYRSVGVQDPKVNFNFDTINSGSWQRLRMDCSTDQIVTQSNGIGEILLTDFTQNDLFMTGSQFLTSSQVVVPQTFYFSYISPKFDEASTTEKVRIRGYQTYDKVQNSFWAEQAPVYDIPKTEIPTDNERFTIDFSVVDALNQDIVTIFSTLDDLDNIIGNPELMFSGDYPDLENLRKAYFNKLTQQMNLKSFFEFFKWFDTNIGTFVEQLLPRKTKFLGTNFVVESHMLERPKVEYKFEDIYLGDTNRNALKNTILLQLLTGNFNRY